MERGEIWRVSLDPSVGREQQSQRLVVIVSPQSFNQLTGTPIVLPITTRGSFSRRQGFAVSLGTSGTHTVGVILCDQPRAIELTARIGKRLEVVPETLMNDVLARLAAILG